jgi:hypothetical protein
MIVGSIANIIVVDAARRSGIEINWRRHARMGCRSCSPRSRSPPRGSPGGELRRLDRMHR